MNRRFAVILGLMTATCAASGFVACSSSNSGGGGGEDAGTDHSATGDSTAPDSNPGMDSSTKDSTASETGSEGGGAEGGGDASDGGASCAVYDASGLNEASVQAGFIQVWQVYKCYRCHQNPTDLVDDAGNGILLNGNTVGLGDSGTIFPPNLTNSAPALGCWTDPQIQTAMLQGLDLEGGALCPPMPVFGVGDGGGGKPMDAGTAQEIIDYLRSITPSNQVTTDTTCPAGTTDGGAQDGASDAPQDAPDAG
jgi:hypothetical protein